MRVVVLGLLLLPLFTACPKKVAPEAPKEVLPQGWSRIEGHLCYEPPSFNAAAAQDRRGLRGKALTEATRRWRGNADPGFSLPEEEVDAMETALLTGPDRIERVLPQDHQKCIAWAQGALSLEDYQTWFRHTLETLSRDDCSRPPFELITQYIEVNRRWQIEIPLCQDEQIYIRTSGGEYTVEDKGSDEETPWITAEGDTAQPATDLELPCHQAGCFRGMMVGRFLDREGKESIFPVGKETTFSTPEHGTLTFGVNDVELYDNRFRTKNSVTEFMLVEVRPANSPVSP